MENINRTVHAQQVEGSCPSSHTNQGYPSTLHKPTSGSLTTSKKRKFNEISLTALNQLETLNLEQKLATLGSKKHHEFPLSYNNLKGSDNSCEKSLPGS